MTAETFTSMFRNARLQRGAASVSVTGRNLILQPSEFSTTAHEQL